jgi:uncharacterized phage-like protein YoqJ
VSVYTNKCLECSEAYIKNLLRLIILKGQECCICRKKQVSIWIVDETNLTRGLAVYIRLFCQEHEKKWKEAQKLEYYNCLTKNPLDYGPTFHGTIS